MKNIREAMVYLLDAGFDLTHTKTRQHIYHSEATGNTEVLDFEVVNSHLHTDGCKTFKNIHEALDYYLKRIRLEPKNEPTLPTEPCGDDSPPPYKDKPNPKDKGGDSDCACVGV